MSKKISHYYQQMSKKTPTGYGPSSLPIKGDANFPQNIAIVARECAANAIAYGATKAHQLVTTVNGERVCIFMHNTDQPFKNTTDVKENGLTPNQSGGKGWAFQGSGISFTGSYLCHDPKVYIASNTKEEGWKAASARPDFNNNDWVIEDELTFVADLRPIVGAMLEEFTVVYAFKIPETKQSANVTHMNMIQWLSPGISNNHMTFTFTEGIYDPIKKGPLDEYIKGNRDDVGNRGAAKRRVTSLKEYNERYCEAVFPFEVKQIDIKIDGQIFDVSATVEVYAFPSPKNQNSGHWMINIRDSEGKTPNGKPLFKKDGGSGSGLRPVNTNYLVCSALGNKHEGDSKGDDEERFLRFDDNAVSFGHNGQTANLLRNMGFRYENGGTGDGNSFVILMVKITDVRSYRLPKDKDGKIHQITPFYFSNVLNRRADFLFDREKSNKIMNAVTEAAAPLVGTTPAGSAMKKWFDEHFPASRNKRVPILFDSLDGKVKNDKDVVVYDVVAGNKSNQKFEADKNYTIAIWHNIKGCFVSKLKLAHHSRGFEIRPMDGNAMARMGSDEFKKGYNKLRKSLVKQGKLKEDESFPLFNIKVSPLLKLEDDKWVHCEKEEYNRCHNFVPTRGLHCQADNQSTYLIGKVVDVPAKPKGNKEVKRKNKEVKKATGGNLDVDPYEDRHPEIAVTWHNVNGQIWLNLKNDKLLVYDYPDEVGSKTQKLLMELYQSMESIAKGVIDFIGKDAARLEGWEEVTSEDLDEDDNTIYRDAIDWGINKAITSWLNSIQAVNLIEKVKSIRREE